MGTVQFHMELFSNNSNIIGWCRYGNLLSYNDLHDAHRVSDYLRVSMQQGERVADDLFRGQQQIFCHVFSYICPLDCNICCCWLFD